MLRRIIAVVSFAALAGIGGASFVEGAEPQVGTPIPELRLPTIERDKTISLHGLRGKKVLLIEFASW